MRFALLLPLLLAGCAPVETAAETQDEIERVALERFFTEARELEGHLAKAFACLELGEVKTTARRDAPDEVIAALAGEWGVPVYPASACSTGENGVIVAPNGVTGGKMLRVSSLSCSPVDRRCEASISYYVANLAAGGTEVTLTHEGGAWVVRRSESMWIS
ncbi:hypothetical protein [Sphingomicrobium arenosum]|uniref:hypothetical protein n=1 Tax=Sphingomicrobium arenosum TaxID=2233861 RepID=UPI002240F97A|nr:hypothetical protein [Sphingomicrobium arenosum]